MSVPTSTPLPKSRNLGTVAIPSVDSALARFGAGAQCTTKRRRDKPGQRWLDECAESSEWKASVRACFPFRRTSPSRTLRLSSYRKQCLPSVLRFPCHRRGTGSESYSNINARCRNTLLASNFREVVLQVSCRTRRFHAKCPRRILSAMAMLRQPSSKLGRGKELFRLIAHSMI